MYFYIIIALIIFLIYNSSQINTEKFTDNENILAEEILKFFKQPMHPFGDYLSILTTYKNTSDNLISKGVYNKLRDNINLTINDILSEF